ncbi:uncharacterized protein BXZ73DRAFT_89427 [Epithele typhae]|uniref:uncharacterized protein n=1 Tax=Epithele typhae TaxID=378194 RepID=UPI002007CEC5|nr:uncharacterized protein BXZ73DRAFT_89427 [Epithele typhae]KAH9935934.1 hypothetical protein BXZ73DRAFT_89427 [Epithele typhae]
MAVLSLPLTFSNSFWTEDYRKGLEVLYGQLEQDSGRDLFHPGNAENAEAAQFVRARAAAELAIGATLKAESPANSTFEKDDGASLHMAMKGLREATIAQGLLHETVAKELIVDVAEPFEKWAENHKNRLLDSKANTLEGWVYSYEHDSAEVTRLKNDYLTKTRKADEADDDARFAPITHPVGDQYTSPKIKPLNASTEARRPPQRQATMSERITARLKEFRLNAGAAPPPLPTKPEVHFDADEEEKVTPKADKGKGRASDVGSGGSTPKRMMSPPPLDPPMPPARINPPRLTTDPVPPPPPPPMDVAGVMMSPTEVTTMLKKAKESLDLRPIRFPLLGEYQDAFSGEEFATWLKENVKEFNGNLDHAEVAGRILTEKFNLLRRIGDLGNDFENADDAFYQFRARAFNLDVPAPTPGKGLTTAAAVLTPIEQRLSPLAQNVAGRTGGLASLVSKAFNANGEPAHVRARREAETADQDYRTAVRKLDKRRLGLEERIEETLKLLQKWELERLRAIKTVLAQYHTELGKLSTSYSSSTVHVETLMTSFQPESDIKVLIERSRTGPFRPVAQVYESIAHDESDVVFGIDLRKWADSAYWNVTAPGEKKEEVPPMLSALLAALVEAYPKLPSDAEKRKTWVYEVPLPAVHHLRETLSAVPPEEDIPHDMLEKYDAPVLASGVRLWALELDPPLCMYEGWDEFRKLYPTVGSSANPVLKPTTEQHILDVQAALQKLPKVHLCLIKSTKESETENNEVYIAKLALSLGRSILRPKTENHLSLQDRHPTLLFIDLLGKYDEILPPAIIKKKRESERKVPVRRRTRPVDMRMSRSRISAGMDLKELQAQQLAQRGIKVGSKSPPPVPAIPGGFAAATTAVNGSRGAVLPQVPESPRQFTDEPQGMVHDEPASFSEEPEELPTIIHPPPPLPGDIALNDSRTVDFSTIPPPPPLPANIPPPPAITPPPPAHPVFKEPPPETDGLPPRPQFKEPPPEPATPTRPAHFAEPSFDDVERPYPAAPKPVPAGFRRSASPSVVTTPSDSRSPSPSKSVTPTSTSTPPLRGPRISRGPRPASSLNRQSLVGRPASPGALPEGMGNGASGLKRQGSRTMTKRSSISRVSELSRRTMASDAEDEIVQ